MSLWSIDFGGGSQSVAIFELWRLFFFAACGVAAIVYGLIFWCVWRYHDRFGKGPARAPKFNRNNGLELTWTLLPLFLVLGLFVLTFQTENYVDAVGAARGGDADVHVTGFRWSWRFAYPGEGVTVIGGPNQPPQMVIPIDQPTHITLTSADVYHAFYVPALLFKRDAIPGLVNRFDFNVTKPGVYTGSCAEFCGVFHSAMTFSVKAVSPAAYRAWLKANRSKETVSWQR
jgi:cytochrome c oxidase subunit II